MRPYYIVLALALVGGAALSHRVSSTSSHDPATRRGLRPQRAAASVRIAAGKEEEQNSNSKKEDTPPSQTPLILPPATTPDPTLTSTTAQTAVGSNENKAAAELPAATNVPYDERCEKGQYYVRLYVKNGRAEDCLVYGRMNPYVVATIGDASRSTTHKSNTRYPAWLQWLDLGCQPNNQPLTLQLFNDLMDKPCETWVVDNWANSGMIRRLYDFDGIMEAHTRVVVRDAATDIKAEEPPVHRKDSITSSVTNGVSYSFSQMSANNKVQVNFQIDGYLNGDDAAFALSNSDEGVWEANKGKIILACVLALLSVIACLIGYCCCRRRRRARKAAASLKRSPKEVPLQQRTRQQSERGGGLPSIVVEPTAPFMPSAPTPVAVM